MIRNTNNYIIPCFIILALLSIYVCGCEGGKEFSTDDIETGSMNIPSDQQFEIAQYSIAAIEKSLLREGLMGGFTDLDSNGTPDSVTWGESEISAVTSIENARGIIYGDRRHAVFYPSDVDSIPEPGGLKLLGFLHYFDDHFLDISLAVILKQRSDLSGRKGTQVVFINASGERVGNPAYGLYPKTEVEKLSTYIRWTESGLDYAIARDPGIDSFFILMKDFGFDNELMVISFSWY